MLVCLSLLVGCSGDETYREVESQRKSGQPGVARETAIQLLNEKPTRMKVWLEFARACTDMVRPLDSSGDDPLPMLVQAGLVCGAINLKYEQQPPADWQEACRFLSVELSRQCNVLLTQLNSETRAVDYLKTLDNLPDNGESGRSGAHMQAAIAVDKAKRNARSKLERITILEELLNVLPGGAPAAESVTQQLDLTRGDWLAALQLTNDYSKPINEAMHARLQGALDKASGDLKELGYILPGTILENGVL
jgi:hypothetical protein